MKYPKDIPIEKFRYTLPDDRIARYPLKERDKSRLLIYKNGDIRQDLFKELPLYLKNETHLVFNVSKVIHARLKFRKSTGAEVEIFCLEPYEPHNYQLNFSSEGSVTWRCIVGNSKKWKGEILKLCDETGANKLCARQLKKEDGIEIIRFYWEPFSKSFSEMIELFGHTPIPPYLKREAEKSDSMKYQTVYSRYEGSVAAPTAGLHFTGALLNKIFHSDFRISEVTLHVGAGTFTPVKEENGIEHKMHVERFHIEKKSLESLIRYSTHITPIGTTSCRTLESLYWMGVKIIMGFPEEEVTSLGQFEAYELDKSFSRQKALTAIHEYLIRSGQKVFFGSTGIMISPGYDFKMTDSLITNFHQPASTLILLIAAFTGEKWKDIYTYALKNGFRFLSYGDSSLLFRS